MVPQAVLVVPVQVNVTYSSAPMLQAPELGRLSESVSMESAVYRFTPAHIHGDIVAVDFKCRSSLPAVIVVKVADEVLFVSEPVPVAVASDEQLYAEVNAPVKQTEPPKSLIAILFLHVVVEAALIPVTQL